MCFGHFVMPIGHPVDSRVNRQFWSQQASQTHSQELQINGWGDRWLLLYSDLFSQPVSEKQYIMFAEYLRGGWQTLVCKNNSFMPPKQALMDGFHWADLSSFLLPKSTCFISLLTFPMQISVPQVNWNWDLVRGLWNSLSCIMDEFYVSIYWSEILILTVLTCSDEPSEMFPGPAVRFSMAKAAHTKLRLATSFWHW